MVKKETAEEDLLATEEAIANLHQDLKETITEVLMVKKVVLLENLLILRINLEALRKGLLKNLLKNLRCLNFRYS